MGTPLLVDADLTVSVTLPDGGTATGRLAGSGRRLRLEVDRPEVFAARGDARALAGLADGLARRGLVVDVVRGDAVLLRLGATRAPWWQRRLTGSRHIRLGGLRALAAPTRARLRPGPGETVLPDGGLLPPATMWPVAPTFSRRPRRRVTTTHDPARGGQPRLVLVASDAYHPGERQPIHWLGDGVTRIGSGEDCEVRLGGLGSLHAEVQHDDADEYVVLARHSDTRVNGAPVIRQILRTGSRLQVGDWVLVYTREEYADHGRPHGGRIGGELGRQRPQAPRTGRKEWTDD